MFNSPCSFTPSVVLACGQLFPNWFARATLKQLLIKCIIAELCKNIRNLATAAFLFLGFCSCQTRFWNSVFLSIPGIFFKCFTETHLFSPEKRHILQPIYWILALLWFGSMSTCKISILKTNACYFLMILNHFFLVSSPTLL